MPLRANKEKSLHKTPYFQDAGQVPNKIKKDSAKQKTAYCFQPPLVGKIMFILPKNIYKFNF